MPSDKDYKETKLIKQGKQNINPDFAELAEWINKTYNSPVINIFYDCVENKEKRPRLSIIFEYKKDELKFRDVHTGNFDHKKQKEIGNKSSELIKEEFKIPSLLRKYLNIKPQLKYDTNNLLVIFTSFEPIAQIEANSNIQVNDIDKLMGDPMFDDLWKIHRQFSGTTFFFYTDKQVIEYSQNGTKEKLSRAYLHLLTNYDEFGYFKADSYSIYLDSKENFDNNYKSNWFYYDK